MDETPSPTPQPGSPDKPDPGLDGLYRTTVKTPMGIQQVEVALATSGTRLSGTMTLMGRRLELQDGVATEAGFRCRVATRVMMRRMEATVSGRRSGNSISGTVDSPMGTFEFQGMRD